jgi:hypothetical protein
VVGFVMDEDNNEKDFSCSKSTSQKQNIVIIIQLNEG